MKEKIIDILVEVCDDESIRDDLDKELVESGLLDSMAFVEFLLSIEEEIGLSISASEIGRDDFNTANKIIKFVTSKIE